MKIKQLKFTIVITSVVITIIIILAFSQSVLCIRPVYNSTLFGVIDSSLSNTYEK